jgi:hypothetical protein
LDAEIGDEVVALRPDGGTCFSFSTIAADVWKSLATPKGFEELRDELLATYDVGADECSRDLRALLDDLAEQGLIREEG